MSDRFETIQKNVDKIMGDVDQIVKAGGYELKENESETDEQKETVEADPQVAQIVEAILERDDIHNILTPQEIDIATKVLDETARGKPLENMDIKEIDLLQDILGKLKDEISKNEQGSAEQEGEHHAPSYAAFLNKIKELQDTSDQSQAEAIREEISNLAKKAEQEMKEYFKDAAEVIQPDQLPSVVQSKFQEDVEFVPDASNIETYPLAPSSLAEVLQQSKEKPEVEVEVSRKTITSLLDQMRRVDSLRKKIRTGEVNMLSVVQDYILRIGVDYQKTLVQAKKDMGVQGDPENKTEAISKIDEAIASTKNSFVWEDLELTTTMSDKEELIEKLYQTGNHYRELLYRGVFKEKTEESDTDNNTHEESTSSTDPATQENDDQVNETPLGQTKTQPTATTEEAPVDTNTQNTNSTEQQLPQESVEEISRRFMNFLEEEKERVNNPDTPEERELYENAPESYKNFMMFTRAVERLANQPEVPPPYKQTISSNLSTLAEMPPKPDKDFKKYADAAEAIITAMDNFTHPYIREATREHISEIFSPELGDYMKQEGYSIATNANE